MSRALLSTWLGSCSQAANEDYDRGSRKVVSCAHHDVGRLCGCKSGHRDRTDVHVNETSWESAGPAGPKIQLKLCWLACSLQVLKGPCDSDLGGIRGGRADAGCSRPLLRLDTADHSVFSVTQPFGQMPFFQCR